MFTKKLVFLFLAIICLAYSSYAQSLTAKEAVVYYNEGVKAQKSGDFDAAIRAYQKASLLSYDYNKFIMNNQAAIYAQKGDLRKAEALLKEVIVMDPDYVPAKLNLGLIYDAYGDRYKALEYWADAFEIDRRKPKNFVVDEEQSAEK